MEMIRATLQIRRSVNKFKEEYPILHRDFTEKIKDKKATVGTWVWVSDDAYDEYYDMCKKHLKVTKLPRVNREVMITTHNGGKYAGFYSNGKWWYRTISDTLPVDALVIKWEKL